jgi:hypothetical protein
LRESSGEGEQCKGSHVGAVDLVGAKKTRASVIFGVTHPFLTAQNPISKRNKKESANAYPINSLPARGRS